MEEALLVHHPECSVHLVTLEAKDVVGDKDLVMPLYEMPCVGVFTKTVEVELLNLRA